MVSVNIFKLIHLKPFWETLIKLLLCKHQKFEMLCSNLEQYWTLSIILLIKEESLSLNIDQSIPKSLLIGLGYPCSIYLRFNLLTIFDRGLLGV